MFIDRIDPTTGAPLGAPMFTRNNGAPLERVNSVGVQL